MHSNGIAATQTTQENEYRIHKGISIKGNHKIHENRTIMFNRAEGVYIIRTKARVYLAFASISPILQKLYIIKSRENTR